MRVCFEGIRRFQVGMHQVRKKARFWQEKKEKEKGRDVSGKGREQDMVKEGERHGYKG